ncbi:hypothetical protein GGS20DRAFT_579928 [Poronia punctata]|nr:hypothetical protein GGS20DRAFT_579928 [Poronia punctata]
MGKRSYDMTGMLSPEEAAPPVKLQKSGRSHEENQERAYIAASRRSDRSIEARVQSAKMASEIHKRRTGRALKVSEELVEKEAMYEEVDDDIPRAYRYLTAQLQTSSPEMNRKLSDYVATSTALAASVARYEEINKLFGEAFPRMASMSQASASRYAAPLFHGPTFTPPPSASTSSLASRNHSISAQSQYSNMDPAASNPSARPSPTTLRAPTPCLSPAVTTGDSLEPTSVSYPTPHSPIPCHPLDPKVQHQIDPHIRQRPPSSFTSELPNEVKMMANIDMNDPMAMQFYGYGNPPEPQAYFDPYGDMPSFSPFDESEQEFGNPQDWHDSLSPGNFSDLKDNSIPPPASRFGTPGSGGPGNDGWESLVDFGAEQ